MNILKHWYWKQNPDVAHIGIPPIRHWIKYGRKEGRALLPPFWYIRAINSLNLLSYSKYLNAEEEINFHISLKGYTKIRITRTNFYKIDKLLKLYFKELVKNKTLNILFQEGKALQLKKINNKLIINLPKKSLMSEFEIELLNHLINTEQILYLEFENCDVYEKFIEVINRDMIIKHEISILSMTKDAR